LKQRGAIGLILVLLLTMMPMEVFSDTGSSTDAGKQVEEEVVATVSDSSHKDDDDDGIPAATGSNQAPDEIPIIDDLEKGMRKLPEGKVNGTGWSFDSGVLHISDGSVLADYLVGEDRPWESVIEEIESIEIDDGIDRIGGRAFEGCINLEAVDFSDVTELRWRAFYGCGNLKTVNLSEVTELGEGAFYGCTKLELTEEGFHEGLTTIPYYAFYGCENLKTVNLSDVTELGEYAFSGCTKLELTEEGFHEDLKTIPACAFSRCENLKIVNLSHITTLGYESFSNCVNLKAVILPENKPIMDDSAFDSVPPLLLLIRGGQPYADATGFPEGSSVPYITGASSYKVNDTIELTVFPEQAELLACEWYFDDELLPGETNRTLTVLNAQTGNSGRYECRLTLENVTVKVSQDVTVSRNYSGGGSGDSAQPQGIWKKDAVGWWYEYPNGTYPRAEWKLIAGITYYFHPSGYMATGWLNQNGAWYMLEPGSGRMIAGDWYLYRDDWYYFDKDGRMVTGWLSYKDNYYYLSTTEDQYQGRMLKDQVTPDGYQVDETGKSNRM